MRSKRGRRVGTLVMNGGTGVGVERLSWLSLNFGKRLALWESRPSLTDSGFGWFERKTGAMDLVDRYGAVIGSADSWHT